MRPLIYFVLILAAAACEPDAQAPSSDVSAELTLGIERSCGADIGLFFAGTPLADRDGWYGRHLTAMGERALCPSASATSYRFLWLRTFHHPVAIRVDRTDTGSFLTAHELSGAGGYKPGSLIRTQARALSDSEWSTLERAIFAAEFWQLQDSLRDQ